MLRQRDQRRHEDPGGSQLCLMDITLATLIFKASVTYTGVNEQ